MRAGMMQDKMLVNHDLISNDNHKDSVNDDSLIYLLVTTEFKRTSQKLGKLEDYSKKLASFINEIDIKLLDEIKNFKAYNSRTSESHMVKTVKKLHHDKNKLEDEILYIFARSLGDSSIEEDDEFTFKSFYDFYIDRDNHDLLREVIGYGNYQKINNYFMELMELKVKRDYYEKYIKLEKDDEKERIKINQKMAEEQFLLNYNIKLIYNNSFIYGSEFKAVILNHHFFCKPYLHIMYTVLKYDLVKKQVYVDIFTTTEQYIKKNFEVKQKHFTPKMFDENLIINVSAEMYSMEIYEKVKKDLLDQKLMIQRLTLLNNFILETNNSIDLGGNNFKLKLQKNFAQYMKGETPINDIKKKIELCFIKVNKENPVVVDPTYNYVINKVKEIVNEKGMLKTKKYTIVATSVELLKRNIVVEKEGEEDGHAEAKLMKLYCNDKTLMDGFQSERDMIYVVRILDTGRIGCGLPCSRCVTVLVSNKIHRVIFSINENDFKYCDMDQNKYTYTTTGNKLLNTELYLYDDYILRIR